MIEESFEPGEDAARRRLDALFADVDRLTPDELGRIGLSGWDPDEREELRRAVDLAAGLTGREALVAEARERARESLLQRYAAGTLHATWVSLNWGVSQGSVENRVAVIETIADAASAAVVADALDPEVYEALALPANELVAMAGGMASEGALGRQIEVSGDDPDLRPPAIRRYALALVAGAVTFGFVVAPVAGYLAPDAPALALAAGALAGTIVAGMTLRQSTG